MCVMEAVSYVAGEPFTDHPACASPTIAAFMRSWNDRLNNDDRQKLKPWIARLVGSRGTPEIEERRKWMFADWAFRTALPMYLDQANLQEHARALRDLPAITNWDRWRDSYSVRRDARLAAWNARQEAIRAVRSGAQKIGG